MGTIERARRASAERLPARFEFTVHADEFRSLPMPDGEGKVGVVHVRVTDLPARLGQFTSVNPRSPKRTQAGALAGPVIKGIRQTLLEQPDDMVLKNQGLYLLVDEMNWEKSKGGAGQLTILLSDPNLHGLVNGGHTFAVIRDVVDSATDEELKIVERAFVRVHLLENVDESKVPEIAEGLNRSKQVDDPSLLNLEGRFEAIKANMKGRPGEDAIAYHQGDDGEMYITDVLVLLSIFNRSRYDHKRHPHTLYRRPSAAQKAFVVDSEKSPKVADLLISRTFEILRLADLVRQSIPESARVSGFDYGRMKAKKGDVKRVGTDGGPETPLPFLNSSMKYRVPNGWVYPILAAFRANVDWDPEAGRFRWKVPNEQLIEAIMPDLVEICVKEHRDGQGPDVVGKRESTYKQCYDQMRLHLLTEHEAD